MGLPTSVATSRRRVLVVTTWFPNEDRPSEAPFNLRHAQAIAQFADVRVIHIRLGRRSEPVDEVGHGLHVRRLSLSPRHPLRSLRSLRSLRRALLGADVVHTMAFSSISAVLFAAPFARVPWVHTEHWSGVVDPASVSPRWERFSGARMLLSAPDTLTAVSRRLSDVIERFGSGKRAAVVPCVVENPNPISAAPVEPPLALVSVGGLVPGKRPVLAVRTIANLRERGVPAMLTWVGDGPLHAVVSAEAARLGVGEHVKLVGAVRPEDVFDHLDRAQFFFGPTRSETFYVSAAEALSAGRPVVVAPVGGFTDYLSSENAVLVCDETPEGYADAILVARDRFMDVDPRTIASPIRQRFSLSTIGRQFLAVYETTVAQAETRSTYLARIVLAWRRRAIGGADGVR